MKKLPSILLVSFLIVFFGITAGAQVLFTDAIAPAEFAARRAKVFEQIGDGVVVLQGTTETSSYLKFRQSNQFFYLTGVEVPRAILVMDGRTRQSTVYLPPNPMANSEGPMLEPGPQGERVSGLDHVLSRDEFVKILPTLSGRIVYTTFRGETVGAGTPDREASHAQARNTDPWDQEPSREEWFMSRLKERANGMDGYKNLDPILDSMRLIKSPREIDLIREATRLAGLAQMEAMRSARPGMYEYEIEAIGDYIFKRGNAQGIAYFALVATGTNAAWPHYHAAQSPLKPGDLVLFDYAPDYKYYQSDVTRMFPADGKFTDWQREIYGVYVKLYQALMTSIRPNVQPREVAADALKKMDSILASYPFKTDKIKAAAERFVEPYRRMAQGSARGSLGHMVGMEVHDVNAPFDVLKPGMVFTIEPAMTIPEDRVYIRLEDTLVITATGYENLSGFVPVEIDAVEKLMKEPGIAQKVPKP
jgi:Xaa-Pro aminopeptidase